MLTFNSERRTGMKQNNFLFRQRDFRGIELWQDVKDEQWYNANWQVQNTVRTVDSLKKIIKLSPYQASEIQRTIDALRAAGKDPMRITPYYASLISEDPFNPVMLEKEKAYKRIDPVFWQSVPTPAHLLFPNTGIEESMSESFRSFGAAYQRYPNRVALFVAENSSCASYCTHCQRAKSLDCTAAVSRIEINRGLFYIGSNQNIDEVLVTGGDALMISIPRLKYVLEELSKIPHLRLIRIATRVPVVLPMKITDELLDLIIESANKYNDGIDKHIYFMTHVNHFHEITEDFYRAVKKIRMKGFTIRNQTVLLNHINDYYKTLAETFRRLIWTGVHPYYLLQCHKERGLIHFITPVQIGKIYSKHLQGWISGIARPVYAANVEGGGGKVLLMHSGHDTLNLGVDLEDRISDSFATIETWDGRKMNNYEALGRATKEEFEEATKIMDKFLGREGLFKPRVIIIDEKGDHIETSHRRVLPSLTNEKKTFLLDYIEHSEGFPLTNPAEVLDELEKGFQKSRYAE